MTFATIIALAVVYAVGSVIAFRPGTNGNKPSQDHYLLSVKFKPPFTVSAVVINVKVDGVPLIPNLNRHLAPWSTTMVAEKGALVVLTAAGPDEITFLDCFISRNGVPVTPQGLDEIFGPGTVKCST